MQRAAVPMLVPVLLLASHYIAEAGIFQACLDLITPLQAFAGE